MLGGATRHLQVTRRPAKECEQVIVRLMVLFLAGCAFTALLGMAAAAPTFGEREYSDFRACIASIPHPRLPSEFLTRDVAAVYCYKVSGGLSATQFELATGFDPQYEFFSKHVTDAPILSKRRFPKTMLHARDGTWWNHSCS